MCESGCCRAEYINSKPRTGAFVFLRGISLFSFYIAYESCDHAQQCIFIFLWQRIHFFKIAYYFCISIQEIIETSRNAAYRAASASMVRAYWNIGRLIVEEEQKGEQRAGYGQQLIESVSMQLQSQYGKGFTPTNLKYMKQFYRLFEKSHALRDELSWTHYRLLLKVEKAEARQFYIEETIAGNWNTRTLERQINSLYYERLLVRREVPEEISMH